MKRLHKVEYSVATLPDELPGEFKQRRSDISLNLAKYRGRKDSLGFGLLPAAEAMVQLVGFAFLATLGLE